MYSGGEAYQHILPPSASPATPISSNPIARFEPNKTQAQIKVHLQNLTLKNQPRLADTSLKHSSQSFEELENNNAASRLTLVEAEN